MSHRIPQVNEVIRRELSSLLLTEVEFPQGLLVTITRVETSKDIRHAKIWLSILPNYLTKKVLDKLKKSAGRLQFLLNQRLSLKPLPKISFVIDETEKKATEIEELLDRICYNCSN